MSNIIKYATFFSILLNIILFMVVTINMLFIEQDTTHGSILWIVGLGIFLLAMFFDDTLGID